MSLLVIVPTRSRADKCTRLMESFEKTTDNADLLFASDADDDSYEGMDWRGHGHGVMDPRPTTVEKLNLTANAHVDDYDQIMWTGNDHVFVTPHWDSIMLGTLKDMGGSGWVYPDDKRRSDIPETWLCSSDVIRELGWFANPALSHYYIDNSIADLGRRTGLLRYCPDAVVEHRHYSVDDETEHDALYREAEHKFGQKDLEAYSAWRLSAQAAIEVSRLRRAFNPDVQWVLDR
jgi:hypothetical protein